MLAAICRRCFYLLFLFSRVKFRCRFACKICFLVPSTVLCLRSVGVPYMPIRIPRVLQALLRRGYLAGFRRMPPAGILPCPTWGSRRDRPPGWGLLLYLLVDHNGAFKISGATRGWSFLQRGLRRRCGGRASRSRFSREGRVPLERVPAKAWSSGLTSVAMPTTALRRRAAASTVPP